MQARVKWVEGLTFIGESASGHQILMDGNSGDKAPSPMEMVLMAAGGCSAIDVVSILQKGRQNVTNCEVKVDLSAEKYCSVALMLEKAVNITHSYEVIEG
ncbi:MAG: OsmC family protein [Klebsiella michiganensis]|nr:OsmC family protein [Klebsiella michiganensis]